MRFGNSNMHFAPLMDRTCQLSAHGGGNAARKSYHNFKNFYSVVLMAMVDAKMRFIWASCGYPGNSHDSTIFQSTKKYADIVAGSALPGNIHNIDGDSNFPAPPIILGDSAFPLASWLFRLVTPFRLEKNATSTIGFHGQGWLVNVALVS